MRRPRNSSLQCAATPPRGAVDERGDEDERENCGVPDRGCAGGRPGFRSRDEPGGTEEEGDDLGGAQGGRLRAEPGGRDVVLDPPPGPRGVVPERLGEHVAPRAEEEVLAGLHSAVRLAGLPPGGERHRCEALPNQRLAALSARPALRAGARILHGSRSSLLRSISAPARTQYLPTLS